MEENTGDGRSVVIVGGGQAGLATGYCLQRLGVELAVFGPSGEPRNTRRIVHETPGLYFVGPPWQHRPGSSLIGGVGTDAEHITRTIRGRVA